MDVAGYKLLKSCVGERFDNIFYDKDANMLAIQNVFVLPSHKRYTKGVYV